MLVGLCASAFTVGKSPWVRICAYLFAAAVRILARLTLDPPRRAAGQSFSARLRALATPGGRATLFGESLMLRMATSCVTAFLISVWAIVAGGYRYYDLFGAFLAMVAAAGGRLVYAPFFAPERRGTLPWEAAAGSLLCSVCYAVRDVSLFGISAAAFLAFVLTLVVTRQCGTGRGRCSAPSADSVSSRSTRPSSASQQERRAALAPVGNGGGDAGSCSQHGVGRLCGRS